MSKEATASENGNNVILQSVEDLQKILRIANMLNEQQQIELLLNQIAESEKNYAAVMQELTEIKGQLKEILDRSASNPETSEKKAVFAGLVEQAGNTVTAQKQNLLNVKQDLNEKAKHVVQNFKNMGIKALNNVCSFLGIQEKLIEMRDHARSAEADMKIAIAKLDGIEKEISGAAAHIGNIGKIVSDKEAAVSANPEKEATEKQEPALFRMLKKYFQKRQNTYAKRAERLTGAIEKFQALEQKASVIKKLSENREKVAANEKEAGDKSLNPISEHKKDEAER